MHLGINRESHDASQKNLGSKQKMGGRGVGVGVVDGATVLLPCTPRMLRADSDTRRKRSRYEQSRCCFCDNGNDGSIKEGSGVRSSASNGRSA